MRSTSGFLIGKFAPLTTGHIDFILKAAEKVDMLQVFLSFDQKFLDTLSPYMQDKLCLRNRELALLETFKNFSNIQISVVDESDIPGYPEGAGAFAQLVRDKMSLSWSYSCVFSSEPSYTEYFTEHFPDSTHVIVDAERKAIPISATMVRSDINKYWDFIAPAARKFFAKKVAIVGVESTGKSTLTESLALYYNTNSVEEVGRTICEQEFHCIEDHMTVEDYEYVAMAHRLKEREMIKTSNRLLVCDTNNLITAFSVVSAGKVCSPLLKEMMKSEYYDLIIFLDHSVKWVYDPLRKNGTQKKRAITEEMLLDMVACTRKDKRQIHLITGDYRQRKESAIKAIDEMLNNWETIR